MTASLIINPKRWIGSSRDKKPTGVPIGSEFYEYDTHKIFRTHDGSNWRVKRPVAAKTIYGVSWDENADTYVRTGNLQDVAASSSAGSGRLPIQAAMKRCILSAAGVVQYYLEPEDSYNREGVAPSVTGTDDAGAANKVSDNGVFTGAAGEYVGRYVHNITNDTYALITAKDSDHVLSIDADIMSIGETFEICTAVLNGDDGQVMVEIPKFYYRYTYSATTHTWEVTLSSRSNFVVHPAFVKNGVEVDYRYIGAFEGIGYDNGIAAYIQGTGVAATQWAGGPIDTANDKLGSVAGYKPVTDETRAEFRAICGNVGAGWRQNDEALFSAIQLLYLVEYADFYSQAMIGTGNTSYDAWDYDECIAKSGMSLGDGNGTNASDTVENDIGILGGDTNGEDVFEYMTYRGIENFYGSTWQWIDGFNINNNIPYLSNNDTHFADDTAANYTRIVDIAGNGITLHNGDGYQQTLEQIVYGFLSASVGGASNTYITDYYWQAAAWRVVMRSGSAVSGSQAGTVCMSASGVAANDASDIGGRLCF